MVCSNVKIVNVTSHLRCLVHSTFSQSHRTIAASPGVGAKTAQRLSLHILKRSTEEVEALAQALIQAKQQVGSCTICGHLSAEPICEICAHPSRDNSIICVVADSRDLIALEKHANIAVNITFSVD